MLRWKLFRNKPLAIAWLLIMSALFCLPGNDLPGNQFLEKIHFDKMVHIGLFAVLLFLWRSAFEADIKNYTLILLVFALIYGLLVEFVQKYWIPLRSFDLYDVLADMTGAVLGVWVWQQVYKKNKPL